MVLEIAGAAVIAWAVAEWRHRKCLERHRKFLENAPRFWDVDPGAIRFAGNGLEFVDQNTGHETHIGPGHISFRGPGKSIWQNPKELGPANTPHVSPQSGVRRMEIGMTGGESERAGLKIFTDTYGYEYTADYEQTVEIAVEKDGTIQTRGIDPSDPRSIMRYRQYVPNGEANPTSPAYTLAARFDEEARRREAHLEARIAELERKP